MTPEKDGIGEFELRYDDVAQALWESLVDKGYVPTGEEMMDFTDIVMDMILQFHMLTGGIVTHLMYNDDPDLEEDED